MLRDDTSFGRHFCGKSGWKEGIKVCCCCCWIFFLKGKWNPALSADNLEWWWVVIIAPIQRSSGPCRLSKQRWFAQSSWAQKQWLCVPLGVTSNKQPKLLENSRKFHTACLSSHWLGLPGSRGVKGYIVCVNFVNTIQKGMCWCRKKNTNIRWPSQSAIMLQRFFWLQV